MQIIGLRQAEQFLQQHVNGRGALQVAPACHLADILRRIIGHHDQMIAGRHIFARQHHIAVRRRIRRYDFCRAGAIFNIA